MYNYMATSFLPTPLHCNWPVGSVILLHAFSCRSYMVRLPDPAGERVKGRPNGDPWRRRKPCYYPANKHNEIGLAQWVRTPLNICIHAAMYRDPIPSLQGRRKGVGGGGRRGRTTPLPPFLGVKLYIFPL